MKVEVLKYLVEDFERVSLFSQVVKPVEILEVQEMVLLLLDSLEDSDDGHPLENSGAGGLSPNSDNQLDPVPR